jgi:tetratricopeptide (TPR) repeat protein
MLGRYEDAITAADSSLSVSGNLTTTHSIAYYNKGDALRHLGRTNEARDMFYKAQALDPTLIPPDMSVPVTPVEPVPTKSPLSPVVAIAGIAGACAVCLRLRSRN